MHVVESGRRLSQSMLWQRQRDQYDVQGIQAWSRGNVPQSITTSPYIARAYAAIVLGYLRDVADQLDRSAPVYVLELGAGSGRFGYRFIKRLSTLLEHSTLRDVQVTYVMTDVSSALLTFWQEHPRLRPLVPTGQLDFAQFDAVHLNEIVLANSNTTLRHSVNPLVLVGNYFFDSIPQDSFSVRDHQLFENLVQVVTDGPRFSLKDAGVSFEAQPASLPYYADEAQDRVLEHYRERLDNAMFLMPTAGLACMRHFQELSRNRALWLLGDIGSTSEADIGESGSGGIGEDENFWLAVNFHAVGEYVQQLGGVVLHPPQSHAHLNISAFVLGETRQLGETTLAYDDAIGHLGPDDFFVLSTIIAGQLQALKRGELLAFLRSSGWDSDYFLQCLAYLLESLPELGWTGPDDVRRAAAEVWDAYYPIGDTSDAADVPSGLGVLLYTVGDYAEAMQYFQHSLELVGIDPRTTFNIALCLNRLDRQSEAIEWLDRTLELDPASGQALALREHLTTP